MTNGNDPARNGPPDAGQSSLLGGTGNGPNDREPMDGEVGEEFEDDEPAEDGTGPDDGTGLEDGGGIFDGGLLDDPVRGGGLEGQILPDDARNPDEDDGPFTPPHPASRPPI